MEKRKPFWIGTSFEKSDGKVGAMVDNEYAFKTSFLRKDFHMRFDRDTITAKLDRLS